ncbi:glycosyltransferase [Nocardioides convexus]|uniref:glycosyltransferase family 2 protein n=1 Tax=Nocardioides convexus TaxID=2712224 RepID=UPI0024189786|nr:glycosyltransferase [Nocardioides convexus]
MIATLEALLRLEYDDYEVLVVDNNTDDPLLWGPVEAWCRGRDRVRFLHLADWPGFKSGALNEALRVSDPRAEVIGIVDADYVVDPDFLARCAPLFADPEVAFVQTPQDYRDWDVAPYFRRLYRSYAYFFDVSQRSRAERNGAIFGGTMGLIRRSAMEAAGGWDEWCITEDAELSLRLLRDGGRGLHVDRSFGRGLMPLTFEALKRQRFRWCFGGVQILRMHWRSLLPGPRTTGNRLDLGQRWAYFVGGLQWFGDLASVLFTGFLLVGAADLVLGSGLVVRRMSGLLVACVLVLVVLGALRSLALVRRTSGAGWGESLGAFGIWLALSRTVALASFRGLTAREGVFLRTPKVKGEPGLARRVAWQPVRARPGPGLPGRRRCGGGSRTGRGGRGGGPAPRACRRLPVGPGQQPRRDSFGPARGACAAGGARRSPRGAGAVPGAAGSSSSRPARCWWPWSASPRRSRGRGSRRSATRSRMSPAPATGSPTRSPRRPRPGPRRRPPARRRPRRRLPRSRRAPPRAPRRAHRPPGRPPRPPSGRARRPRPPPRGPRRPSGRHRRLGPRRQRPPRAGRRPSRPRRPRASPPPSPVRPVAAGAPEPLRSDQPREPGLDRLGTDQADHLGVRVGRRHQVHPGQVRHGGVLGPDPPDGTTHQAAKRAGLLGQDHHDHLGPGEQRGPVGVLLGGAHPAVEVGEGLHLGVVGEPVGGHERHVERRGEPGGDVVEQGGGAARDQRALRDPRWRGVRGVHPPDSRECPEP